METGLDVPAAARSARSTVAGLLWQQVRLSPHAVAVDDGARRLDYAGFVDRARRLAGLLAARGVGRGDRVAILSERRLEYLEAYFAAAWLGAVLACQNWRLSAGELRHCLELVEPKAVLVSPRHRPKLDELGRGGGALEFGAGYEADLAAAEPAGFDPLEAVDPEDPLLILYTSGTTGLPKGAVISHRAEIVRNLVIRAEFGVAPEDAFAAWSPLYHMGAAECSIGALMTGGKVIPVDGFDQARLAEVIATEPLGWLLLMPAAPVAGLIGYVQARRLAKRLN